ncbi:ARM repeat-containing protein [Piedraia hortae CBS 480.64]|uniref:ARM repeat-containing protein n=1 Tax=Piedraia hortae CBS 480.64 TaxID=1314780 RepID=A0A6A7BSN0_9PEZI|nr:ARM repeat-containing protein [Piedraia hortae CBS 480.64]
MADQKFVELLQTLLQPNTEHVKAATEQLNTQYYTDPAAVTALVQITMSNQAEDLRQLAAVEARKLVPNLWENLPDQQKTQIRQQLLQSTTEDEKPLSRHSKARVLAAMANQDLPVGKWTELPAILERAAVSSDVKHREVAVYIIYTLLEAMSPSNLGDPSRFLNIFVKTIQDQESPDVALNTMLALGELARTLEDEKHLKTFQTTIPHMARVLQRAIEDKDDVRATQACDTIDTLVELDSALLGPHLKDLMQFFIQVAVNTDLDNDIRTQAIGFLMSCVRFRRYKVQTFKLGEPMVKMCLQIALELPDDSEEEDDDDFLPGPAALALIDTMAESLPPSHVVVPLLKAAGPFVQNSDPRYRRAGISAVGMCVEGAPDFINTQLSEIMPLVLHLLADSSTLVRSATLDCLARLADDLAEDVGKEHAKLIPALIKNFDHAVQAAQSNSSDAMALRIIKASCIAIDALVDGFEPDVAALYVDQLTPRFETLFGHPDHRVQLAAISATGSLAAAAEDKFKPYFQKSVQSLGQFVTRKDSNDDLDLRAMSIDALGKIACAVGGEAFQPFVKPLMQSTAESLQLDHQRLKETAYIFWSAMARVYQEEFSPFLPGVVESLLACINQDETGEEIGVQSADLSGQQVTVGGKKFTLTQDNEDELVDADDALVKALLDAASADDWDDIGAVTGVAMEKEIAVEVLGDVLANTKNLFVPYFPKTVTAVMPMLEHSFEGIRKSAVGTLWRSYASVWGIAEGQGMQKWRPGLPLAVTPPEDLQKLGQRIMPLTLALWADEADRSTVTDINRNLSATLKLCGPAILSPTLTPGAATPLEQMCAILVKLLEKQHPCQIDEDVDDIEETSENSEYDWLTIDTTLDVVTALSTALGDQFGELWQIFEKPILRLASSQETSERCAAVGTIGECVEGMKAGCTPYTARMMKILLKRLSDEDAETKSNAAFSTGLLCLHSTNAKEVLGSYNEILSKLEPLLHKRQNPSEHEARGLDNAIGCISRMVKKSPQNIPLQEVLPRLIALLPLTEDYRENEPTFDMIVSLYQQQNPVIQGLAGQIKPVLEKVLQPPEGQLTGETREKVKELGRYLGG